MEIETYAENIRTLIAERLKIKGRSPSHAVHKTGRLLPAWARREARYLVQAAEMSRHPKMQARIDEVRVKKAYRDLTEHLRSIDPVERQKTRVIRVLSVIAFNLIVIVAALLTYLVWAGHI